MHGRQGHQDARSRARKLVVLRTIRYFAFGANLSPNVLNRRGVSPLMSEKAILRKHRLCFNHRKGFANLEPSNSRECDGDVHGVVFDLHERDFTILEEAEIGYMTKRILVETYGRQEVEAETFVSRPELKIICDDVDPSVLLPTHGYLEKIREGAHFHGLDFGYQKWLGDLETLQGPVPAQYLYTPSRRNLNLALTLAGALSLALAFPRDGRRRSIATN